MRRFLDKVLGRRSLLRVGVRQEFSGNRMRANLFLKLQNFVVQFAESSLESIKLLLFDPKSFFCFFGVRTNIMDRRVWFDLRIIRFQF